MSDIKATQSALDACEKLGIDPASVSRPEGATLTYPMVHRHSALRITGRDSRPAAPEAATAPQAPVAESAIDAGPELPRRKGKK